MNEFEKNLKSGILDLVIKRKKITELENIINSSKNTTSFFKSLDNHRFDFSEILDLYLEEESSSNRNLFKKDYLKNSIDKFKIKVNRRWI